jgi:hypothetical protein
MSKSALPWAFAIALLAILQAPLYAKGEGTKLDKNCILTLQISSATNPWSGYTSNYQEEQAGKTIRAVPMEQSYERLPGLAAYSGPGGPALAVDRKQKRVVVNTAYFTELQRVDATRQGSGDKNTIIGQYKDLRFSVLTPRRLVLFLLESQIIQTYWHVESHLCLTREEDSPGSYTAHFTGTHIYFTNERNERSLSFSVVVDKKTGRMGIQQ